jgi:VIT1/CCC1 family predicted Fe2+/Mn2+ transporter
LQDWQAVLVMIFKTVTGELLFEHTAQLFGGIKTRVSLALGREASLESQMEDISRMFWRSAVAEFRAKMKTQESALRYVPVAIPEAAKRLFTRVLQRSIASIHESIQNLVEAQGCFASSARRDQLLKSSHRRICQILQAVQRKLPYAASAPDALLAAQGFLQHLATLKALIERKSQMIDLLQKTSVPRLSAYDVILLMFNSVLTSMYRRDWSPLAEETPARSCPSSDELSLATTIVTATGHSFLLTPQPPAV